MPNQIGVYGIKKIPSFTNIPGGRVGTVSWKDIQGNLWMFGGISSLGCINDLWRFVPDTTCPVNNCHNIYINKSICKEDSATLFATSGQSFLWNTGDTTSSITVHPLNTTTYTVNIASGNYSSMEFTVNLITPLIRLGNDTTLCQGDSLLLNATINNGTYL